MSALKEQLAAAGLRPSRRRGQNFLASEALRDFLVASAGLNAGQGVLEIGAGTGILTAALAAVAGRVWACELDERLLPLCRENLKSLDNVSLYPGDFTAADAPEIARLRREVRAAQAAGQTVKVVSSFPYGIASRALVDLVAWPAPPALVIGLVQLEVAQRLVARPGTGAYGLLTVLVGSRARASLLRRVPPGAFWPRPQVWSAVVGLVPDPAPDPAADSLAALARLVFPYRRKTLGRILRDRLPAGRGPAALEKAGLDPARRPGTLAVEELYRLVRALEGLAVDRPGAPA